MAEVRKKVIEDKYNTSSIKKKENKKEIMKETKQKKDNKNTKKTEEKKSLIVKFRIFCSGVKSEFKKVHWTSKKNMIKYSIASIVFILFFSGFFYLIDVIFALIQSIFN